MSTHKYDQAVGLLKRGTIVKFDSNTGTIKVRLNTAPALKGGKPLPITVQAPHSLFYNNGLFMGTLPVEGTPVVVGQGAGGEYHFVSFLDENHPSVPNLDLGVLLIQSNDDTKITLDVRDNILVGSPTNNIHINTDANYISTNFYNNYNFTQGSRRIEGVIKRDLVFNNRFSQSSKLESDDYDSKFKVIPMDPNSAPTNNVTGSTKNPPLVEQREIIYEFQYLSNIEDDLTEASKYSESTVSESSTSEFNFPNRRLSRSDTLSLSLVAPNFLIETIKGTVVDIFGNILDLNREPLAVGQEQNTINADDSTDKVASFLLIKELERKSLAYHFEINARKKISNKEGEISLPDFDSSDDYARSRSRFFLDIDKEGQFKLNVPASSETGNIPLLTRYENYSTIGDDDSGNPNKLVFREDKRDIYQDSFASPGNSLVAGAGFLTASDRGSIAIQATGGKEAAPQDRLTGSHIKHGTVYHDILQTCFAHQNKKFIDVPSKSYMNPIVLSRIPELKNIVNKTITTSGDGANAGGRSGSFNFDGSIEMNIGANTIDRQSWWLDTAGGIVANIGRDINGRSIMAATGGDFFLQVGGFGVLGDSRFDSGPNKQDNSIKGAVLDLRIYGSGGYCHLLRVDDNGITIMTPGNMAIHAKGELAISSDRMISMRAPAIVIQERPVLNAPVGSI